MPLTRHAPRLCLHDGHPLTAAGLCTHCGTVADARESTSATNRRSLSVNDANTVAREAPSGTFDLELLERIPYGMRPVAVPLGSATDLGGELGKIIANAGRAVTKDAVYRLVPSRELADGIAKKTLRQAASKNGDASVLIKDAASGRITGQSVLKEVKAQPAALIGPAAWQAMAMITQQHFLNEINGRLERLEQGLGDVIHRMRAELDSDSESFIAEVDRLRARHSDDLLTDRDRQRIDEMLVRADSIRRRSLKAFRPHATKAAGEVDPSEHLSDLETAYLGFQAQTQLAQLKVAVAPPHEALAAADEEAGRFLDAIPEMQSIAAMLLAHDDIHARQAQLYAKDKREQGPVGRTWDKMIGDRHRLLRNSEDPPRHQPLGSSSRKVVETLARPFELAPQPVVVQASHDGRITLLAAG
jgi:hypothetical protein